jgi:hypothetical protein
MIFQTNRPKSCGTNGEKCDLLGTAINDNDSNVVENNAKDE